MMLINTAQAAAARTDGEYPVLIGAFLARPLLSLDVRHARTLGRIESTRAASNVMYWPMRAICSCDLQSGHWRDAGVSFRRHSAAKQPTSTITARGETGSDSARPS